MSSRPTQVIRFHVRHHAAVMSGEKVTTVRWQEQVAVGPATFVFGDGPTAPTLTGRVLGVETHPLPTLSAADARQPIGTDMAAFAQELRAGYYPDMPDDTEVQVVEIEVLDEPRPTRWFAERTERQRHAYARRFIDIASDGKDVDGEARLIDAMATPGSTVLDAGCGAGRITHALSVRGHRVIGVDADPILVEAGREQHPGTDLRVLDLVDLTPHVGGPFDVIVCTGNVMTYVEPGTERAILAAMATVIAPRGRVVFGFHTDRAYTVEALDQDASDVGWHLEHRFGTWNLDPFTGESDWAVSVFRSA
ncbi:methyltransferase domain-containing protein [Aeromicrobium sp. Leaf350]|uniref:methyltransferase domain-containing protein n=1 Tax=Aeromicrobium sp. Leaf350 TaxID=2876565 RepID=UPI001E4345BE|nr:methyltransferase domain-containing protein [Aeromicrobium sp. Leaf350]